MFKIGDTVKSVGFYCSGQRGVVMEDKDGLVVKFEDGRIYDISFIGEESLELWA